MWESVQLCGWTGLLIVAAAIVALPLGVVAIGLSAMGKRAGWVLGVLALIASLVIPSIGILGTMLGRSVTDEALSGGSVDPSHREKIRQVGYAEADRCTSLGLTGSALPLLLSLSAIGLAFAKRKADEATS